MLFFLSLNCSSAAYLTAIGHVFQAAIASPVALAAGERHIASSLNNALNMMPETSTSISPGPLIQSAIDTLRTESQGLNALIEALSGSLSGGIP